MRKWIIKSSNHILNNLSIIVSSLLFFGLLCILTKDFICEKQFINSIKEVQNDIITISGILSAIIISYLTSKVIQVRNERIKKMPDIKLYTQKLHKFRAIVDRLLSSNIWPDNLRSKLHYDYKGLTYFEVREIIFVEGKPTKQARKFASDEKYGGIAQFILELESFIFKEIPFDQTLYSEFDVSKYYSSDILEKWITFDCGNGLWYYFEHKYSVYKNSLDLNNVYSGYQDEIKNYALQIDKERYGNLDFSPELLAQLGTQVHSDIIPKLYRLQISNEQKLPKIINYLYIILCLLIVFGIALPLVNKVFVIDYFFDIISFSIIASICAFVTISFYGFLKDEINI